jgi:hypothetical protein
MKKLLILGILTSVPVMAQVGLGMSPMRLEVGLRPGQAYSGALELTNELGGRTRTRGELLDFRLDETMTPQFARVMESESEWSCRSWLTVNPMETEIETGQRLLVRFTIRVPATAAPRSYHCAVGFTAMPPAGEVAAMGIRNTVRVVGAFYVRVGEPRGQGTVSSLRLEGEGEARRAVLHVRNDSEFYFRPEGQVEVLDGQGVVLETLTVPAFPVLPKREQRFLLPLAPGTAQPAALRVRVDLGLGEIQEATVRLANSGADGI